MRDYKQIRNVNDRSRGYLMLVMMLLFLLSASFVVSTPSAPVINYVSNTTYVSGTVNRSVDAKGTITTITLDSKQQDFKWKAYVGNVSGTLALANTVGTSIYDWAAGTPTGEVYISRFSNINWASIDCAVAASWNAEHTALGIVGTAADSINATFNYTTHAPVTVGTNPARSGCQSTATYVNGLRSNNPMGAGADFQEILLRDTATAGDHMIYAGRIDDNSVGYDGATYDFQMIVAENESASTPTMYYFWVELG